MVCDLLALFITYLVLVQVFGDRDYLYRLGPWDDA
jgi:hypothetical protein